MKDREINIKVGNISNRQWPLLLVELNLVAKSWKKYGPVMNIKTKNFTKDVFIQSNIFKLISFKKSNYFKTFSGFYTDQFNKKTKVNYKMYVRDLKLNVITAIDKKFEKVLIKNDAYQKKILNGISFVLIDINKAYKLMKHDLLAKGGLVYAKKI